MSQKYTAEQRLAWLHNPNAVDAEGYEWGVYRVKWENGQVASVMQTLGDFSDIDAAMARCGDNVVGANAQADARGPGRAEGAKNLADTQTQPGDQHPALQLLKTVACSACEVGLIGDGPDTQRVCPECDGTGLAATGAEGDEQYKSWQQVSAGVADSHADEALCLECQGGRCTAGAKCEAMTNPPPQMRAEFQAWVRDRGCDTGGAWSAWQGCWSLLTPGVMASDGSQP